MGVGADRTCQRAPGAALNPTASTVRELRRDDLDDLVRLQHRSFGVEAWSRGMLEEEFSRPGGIMLGIGRPLDAYLCAWVVADELHLLQVATDPERRRCGLAWQLLGALHARAQAVSAAWLEVREVNTAAIALYERAGWVKAGLRPRYYADGANAAVYRWQPEGPKSLTT